MISFKLFHINTQATKQANLQLSLKANKVKAHSLRAMDINITQTSKHMNQPDKSLHVVVDRSAFTNSSNNCTEIII
jgi:hypothetical protein